MRRFTIGSFVIFSAFIGGCAASPQKAHAPKSPAADDDGAPAKTVAQLMARENGPFKKHHVELFGGLAAADYESTGPAVPECQKDADEDQSCILKLGPLLDDGGRLIGMNTAKMSGRENVSFAIPTSRVRFALSRAERPRRFDVLHAEATCNVALDGLAAERPSMSAVRRLGLALFDESPHRPRAELRAAVESPIDEARVRAFEGVREAVDGEGGIAPFATCSDVTARGKDGKDGFVANVRTKTGTLFRVALAVETDELRIVSFAQLRGGT